jgi:multiple sugar transport system substrate-binding protein
MRVTRSNKNVRWVLVLAAIIPVALLGCGDEGAGPPLLTWYVNPDNGGQADLAERCSAESGGAFRIQTQVLPKEADAQREQLVRRLAAADSSIDLMSLDVVFVAEFANAGYLLPITDPADVQAFTQDVLEGPRETVFWKDQLVAAPFSANTQLLWYRKSVAAAAGVDPNRPDFTWDEVITAAEGQGKRVALQARRYEGLMVWVNAMVASGGGQILADTEAGDEAQPRLASPAGERAAQIAGRLGRSPAAPADLSTATEEEARASFQSDSGGFMLNWLYAYAAARSAVEEGGLAQAVFDDIGYARYPRVDAATPSAPPLGGINLGLGAYSEHKREALAAARCLTSRESGIEYMIAEGNSATRGTAYDDPRIRDAYPMADLIRSSINDAGPRPVTPFYGDVSVSVQRNWHPPASVTAETPEATDQYIREVLQGDRLL